MPNESLPQNHVWKDYRPKDQCPYANFERIRKLHLSPARKVLLGLRLTLAEQQLCPTNEVQPQAERYTEVAR